jgi:hypothetical protein
MRTTAIVTASESDALLLGSLLDISESQMDSRFVAMSNFSSADSMARTILLHGEQDVALVVDAGAVDPSRIRERERFLQQSLGEVAVYSQWKAFLIKPETDALLFENREVVEELTGEKVDDVTLMKGHYEPRAVLDDLLHGKSRLDAYKERLPQLDLTPLRNLPVIQELKQFVDGASTRQAAA